MLRKGFIFTLAFVFLLSLSSCEKKMSKKIEENITEQILNTTGEDINLDIDGDNISFDSEAGEFNFNGEALTITDEEGEKYSIGEKVWPEGESADLIPEFTKGNIVSSINSSEMCMVMLEEVEEVDFKDYVDEINNLENTTDSSEYSFDDTMGYSANIKHDTIINIGYMSTDKELSITVQIISED